MITLKNSELKRPAWVAFFSQTGKEIVEISTRLNRWPDIIVTNQRPEKLRKITKELVDREIIILPNKPAAEDYRAVLKTITPETPYVITLHGWLRIIPAEVIEEYPNMFNGHPGLITRYPELKGKDPQMKAWNLNLNTSGCVIHQVTAGVDEGPVLKKVELPIRNLTLNELFDNLHKESVNLWCKFLKRHWL